MVDREDSPRSFIGLPKASSILYVSTQKYLCTLIETFVAQICPKESFSKFLGFHFDLKGFRNFYDVAQFGGISSHRRDL